MGIWTPFSLWGDARSTRYAVYAVLAVQGPFAHRISHRRYTVSYAVPTPVHVNTDMVVLLSHTLFMPTLACPLHTPVRSRRPRVQWTPTRHPCASCPRAHVDHCLSRHTLSGSLSGTSRCGRARTRSNPAPKRYGVAELLGRRGGVPTSGCTPRHAAAAAPGRPTPSRPRARGSRCCRRAG